MYVCLRADYASKRTHDGYTFVRNPTSTSSYSAVTMHIPTLPASTEGPVLSSPIAGSVGTNSALIRHLVAQSMDAGFVTSQMGATGGATLTQSTD